jgi:hypothetical protein
MSVTPFATRALWRRSPGNRVCERVAPDPAPARVRALLIGVTAAVLTTCVASAPAGAAALLDVRIGKHEGYTRIVLDLDEGVKHQLDRIETERGSVFLLKLNATSARRVIAPDAPMVSVVRIEPRDGETIVRVAATSTNVDVNVFPLRDPNRLVVDLRSGKAATPTTAAATKPAPPAAKPAPRAPKPTTAAPEPTPAPRANVKISKPILPPPAKTDAPAATPEVEKTDAPAAAKPKTTAKPAAPAEPTPVAQTPTAPTRVTPRGEPLRGTADAAEPGAPEAAPDADRREVRRSDRPRPAPDTARVRPERTPPPAPAAPSGSTGVSPLVIAAAVVALVLVVGAVVIRRRRQGEVEAATDFFPPESDEGVEIGSGVETTPVGAPGPGAGLEPAGMPIPPPKDDEEDLPVAPGTQPAPVAPRPVADAGLAGDVDRRIQGLETRLEEVVDARERLERQVSAQAEELRVQRAAIARAQRVLRTLARPEEATEPAPRDPNKAPSR